VMSPEIRSRHVVKRYWCRMHLMMWRHWPEIGVDAAAGRSTVAAVTSLRTR
jgi:hypothetical protein